MMDLEKSDEREIKLPVSVGSSKKQESPRKTSSSALLTTQKALTVWITTNCGQLLKRWEYQTTWPVSWVTCVQVKKQCGRPRLDPWVGNTPWSRAWQRTPVFLPGQSPWTEEPTVQRDGYDWATELYWTEMKPVRTGHGTINWFQIRKGVCRGCILSPCLFNLHAEYVMRNAGLEESQAGIKIAGRNISNLRYADDTTLMAESEEELKSLLMKVKKLA